MAQTGWTSTIPSPGPAAEWLPALDIPEPGPQSRLTVLLRWLLLIPQFIALWLLGILAFFVVVIGWFGALFTGRLPDFAAQYLTGFLGYQTRVGASAMLLVDRYPPFTLDHRPEGYPVQVEVHPGPLNRLAVFFRLILVIPAAIVEGLLTAGWYTVSIIVWLVVLVLGRMPRPLFEATAAVLRYSMRLSAYLLLLTSAYPKRIFGDDADTAYGTAPEAVSATRPLLLSGLGKGLVVLFLVVGLFSSAAENLATDNSDNNTNNNSSSAPAQTDFW
ncbi:DUF4389 domain-containing protein [Streptacidiphilus sp. N1-12]|uniref:DUF4389 domain-containing protein n=2 Tax=Streptacidiphilus alkalitolerans TaxID=3342712 RepID=A0ABV6V2A6_9ACTN